MDRTGLFFGGLFVGLLLLLALNVLVGESLSGARVDLTEGDLYTLSEGSKSIVRKIDEPITARLYFSERAAAGLAPLRTYAQRVRELLEEYESVSGGKLRVEVIDPEPFSELEDDAVAAGVRGRLTEGRELVYFGLVLGNAVDEREVIPWFELSRQDLLEYDISSAIHRLSDAEPPVLAVLSSLPIRGGGPPPMFPGAPPPSEPWYAMELVEQAFDVREVSPVAPAIPAETDVLLVVHPKDLGDEALYAIDQYVLGGGHAIVFVDPYCWADEPPPDPSNQLAAFMAPRASDLDPLLRAWGLEMVDETVLADRAFAIPLPAGRDRQELVHNVLMLSLPASQLDPVDPVTSQLSRINVARAGVLRPVDGATTETVPLVSSSPEASEIEMSRVQFMADPKDLLTDYTPLGQPVPIAVRVRGPADSAFPDGPPGGADGSGDDAEADATDAGDGDGDAEGELADPDGAGTAGEAAGHGGHRVRSDGPIHVIVVSDVDMLTDGLWVRLGTVPLINQRIAQPLANNGDFLLNALENLSGSDDLVAVRARAGFSRPFEYLEELERKAEERYLAQEQRLQEELDETNRRINEIERQRPEGSTGLLDPSTLAEIRKFQERQLEIRKELRQVQYELNKDIRRTKSQLKAANIAGMPLLVVFAGLAQWIYRSRRRRQG